MPIMKANELSETLWRDVPRKERFDIVDKKDSVAMQVVGTFLDLMRVQNKQEFLRNYTTTLFNTVYIPFEPGIGSEEECWGQIVTLAHEMMHLQQYRTLGLYFIARYLLDEDARTKYEVEAYAASMEMMIWRYGKAGSPKSYAEKLYGYGCSRENVEMAALLLSSKADISLQGLITTPMTKVVLQYIKDLSPETFEALQFKP